MTNYKDIEEIKDFIQGMTHSVTRHIQEEGTPPDSVFFLVKRIEDGESSYGLTGGGIPDHPIAKMIHSDIIPKIIAHQGGEILCMFEVTNLEDEVKLKFTNYITKEETFEIISTKKTFTFEELLENIHLN